jgi:DNA-binding transcriptional MerR regulator
MRVFIAVLILSMAAWSLAAAAGPSASKCCVIDKDCCGFSYDHQANTITIGPDQLCCVGKYNIRIDDGDVILKPRHRRYPKVRITGDYRLYVDDRMVETTDEQKELLKEFHGLTLEIHKEACEIGIEGAKIGMAGAKIGVDAIAGLIRLLSPHYDTDDLERELEAKAARIEANADRLEAKADKIEQMADELEDLESELRHSIPEIESSNRF